MLRPEPFSDAGPDDRLLPVVRLQGNHPCRSSGRRPRGGDPLALNDLFLGENRERPFPILSGAVDGAYSVARGSRVAFREGTPSGGDSGCSGRVEGE